MSDERKGEEVAYSASGELVGDTNERGVADVRRAVDETSVKEASKEEKGGRGHFGVDVGERVVERRRAELDGEVLTCTEEFSVAGVENVEPGLAQLAKRRLKSVKIHVFGNDGFLESLLRCMVLLIADVLLLC